MGIMDPIISITAVALVLLCTDVIEIRAGPLSTLNDISSNAVSEDIAAEEPLLDDFTTHGLERLSSAATCLVAGVEYTHGQQIYRKDPCEFCLCLDGEMFCWWQDCPPAMEGPCKDRGPFTPCLNVAVSEYSESPSLSSSSSSSSSFSTTSKILQTITNLPLISSTYSSDNSSESTPISEDDSYATTESEATSGANTAKNCIVMGRKYEVGAKLPHTTGNCVECICGPQAQVTCSPHQCAPIGDEINDYRPPGPRQAPEVF